MNETFKQGLQNEIVGMASRAAASVGICAIHIESGERVDVNSERTFPLASTYKIPIAIRLLKQVEKGRCSLEEMVGIATEDLNPGSEWIGDFFHTPGLKLSIRNLLGLALRLSDNTASDLILKHAGGADEVTKTLRSIGLNEIRVDRSARQILCDLYGVQDLASDETWSLQKFQTRLVGVSRLQRQAAMEAFQNDPRDRAAPEAIASFLVRLHRGGLLNSTNTDLLLDLMGKCRTGPARLKGQLPAGTVVAHKTGTIEGLLISDVGIIGLPDKHGHIAIAAVTESPKTPASALESLIAATARSIYDAFLLEGRS